MQRWKIGKISIFNSLDVIFDFLMSWVENSNQVLTWDQYQIKSECWNQVFELSQKIDIETQLNDQFKHNWSSFNIMMSVNKISIALQVIMLLNKSVYHSHCCNSWECDSKCFHKSVANHNNSSIINE